MIVVTGAGGHLDCGETLPAAGLREVLCAAVCILFVLTSSNSCTTSAQVQEETGLALDPDTVNFLCGWESNYPIDKPPVRQHLVLDFIGKMCQVCRFQI